MSTTMIFWHWFFWPQSLVTTMSFDHQVFWPPSPLTTKSFDHQVFWPPSPLTTKSFDPQVIWPQSLMTTKYFHHQSLDHLWRGSVTTTRPIVTTNYISCNVPLNARRLKPAPIQNKSAPNWTQLWSKTNARQTKICSESKQMCDKRKYALNQNKWASTQNKLWIKTSAYPAYQLKTALDKKIRAH